MIPLRPLKDRVVVRVHPAEATYTGLLVAPDIDFLLGEQKWRLADVVKSEHDDIPVGCTVIINRDSGTMLRWQGEQYRVLFPSDILAIVEKGDESDDAA